MLKYMVSSRLDAFGAGAVEDRPEQEVLDLLVESGLMGETYVFSSLTRPRHDTPTKVLTSRRILLCVDTWSSRDSTNRRSGRSTLQISSKGFQFLLENRLAQIWQVLMFFVAAKTVGCVGVSYLRI
jgi:hypothetical protein